MLRVLRFISGTMPLVIFLALFGGSAQAAITLNVSPAPNAVVKDLRVSATATSDFEVTSITAKLGTQEIALQPGGSNSWSGSFDSTSIARGEYTVTFQAEDVKGNTATQDTTFLFDRLPVIEVQSPLNGYVATPDVRFTATCTDDSPSGCASFKLFTGDQLLASCEEGSSTCTSSSGVLKIDLPLDASDWNKTRWTFRFEASDGVEQRPPSDQLVTRTVFVNVESGAGLQRLETIPGLILDVSADRILYKATSEPFTPFAPYTLKIRNRANGVDTEIRSQEVHDIVGYLTPQGAVYALQDPQVATFFGELAEWRNGQSSTLDTAVTKLRVKGSGVAWERGSQVNVRDLSADSTTALAEVGTLYDVTTAGDVLYLKRSNPPGDGIYLRRSGSDTLIHGISDPVEILSAQTDGTNVVYTRQREGNTPNYDLFLHTETEEVTLAAGTYGVEPRPGPEYQVNSGWIAFIRPSNQPGLNQIWLRSPQGQEKQISAFSQASAIDTLGANGEITFKSPQFASDSTLYLSGFDQNAETQISSGNAHALRLGGAWYLVENGTLFLIQGTFTGRMGDVNADGSISVADVVLVLSSVAGLTDLTSGQREAADVVPNGSVDVNDAVKILRVVVQLDPPFSG